jgi:predicted transcriptional regulator
MDSSISESARRAIDTISNGEEVQTITLSALSNLKRPELSLFMKAFLAQNDEYRIHVINQIGRASCRERVCSPV